MSDTWTERLSEYIDSTLAEAERGALEAHLAGCAACRTTLDELRRVVARHGARAHTEPGDDRLRDRAGAAGARGRSRQRVFESTPRRHHAAQVGAAATGQRARTRQDLGG